jgi:predicted flap endonuclease-1-like 5' DNA nuclease
LTGRGGRSDDRRAIWRIRRRRVHGVRGMTLFLYGLLAGGILGWSLCRLFTYNEDPQRRPSPARVATPAAIQAADAAEAAAPTIDFRSAAAHGFSVRDEHHLQLIEGIGPKIESLLNQGGVRSFSELAATHVDQLRQMLTAGGPGFKLARPDSWVAQAQLAAAGDWAQLRKLQDQLVGGVERSAG